MKKKIIYLLVSLLSVFILTSCTKDVTENPTIMTNASSETETRNKAVLKFSSPEELTSIVEELRLTDAPNSSRLRLKTRIGAGDFTSLRQHLIEQGLREFSDEELAIIIADSLEYDPQDSLIVDPYFMEVLNEDREVQVGENIYRYIDNGVVYFDAKYRDLFSVETVDNMTANLSSLSELEMVDLVADNNKNITAKFVRLNIYDYNDDGRGGYYGGTNGSDDVDNTDDIVDEGCPATRSDINIQLSDGSLLLGNGEKIPSNKIVRVIYNKGDNNFIGNLFDLGTNVTAINEFNDRHRMKLRMYSKNYYIYAAVGMTIRMQKRFLGIWWRKPAQEMRYGWSALEIEYDFKDPVFKNPPRLPNGSYEYPKYPTAMPMKFPFSNSKILLFNVPVVNYNFTTGDINKVYRQAMNLLVDNMKDWFGHPKNSEFIDNLKGIYVSTMEDERLHIVIPTEDRVAYNTGRKEVVWGDNWLPDEVVIRGTSSDGIDWSYSVELEGVRGYEINRGSIFGAVKYGNQWRACTISTGDKN